MLNISNKVISDYMVRKTKKQKNAFRSFLIPALEELGYAPKIDRKDRFPYSTNVVVGNPKEAKTIITAHYDTQASMGIIPNFLTPKNIWIYLLYQLFIAAIILIFSSIGGAISTAILGARASSFCFGFVLFAIILMVLVYAGPANPKTYNDNTSGVITLLEILAKVKDENKKDICVVFFDQEELGLLGSRYFLRKYKNIIKDKILLNFDCVSDGNNFLFVYNDGVNSDDLAKLKSSFTYENKNFEFISRKKAIYPSDQKGFNKGIGVAAFKKRNNLLYIDKIHTIYDTNFEESNIDALSESFVKYLEKN